MHGRADGVSVYSDGSSSDAHVEDASLLDHLRAALGGAAQRAPEALVVHYQPQVSLVTGEVTGVEALVRWDHPGHGLLPPAGFLGLVERDGLMPDLTVQVLRAAAAACARWAREGRVLRASVNLSTSVCRPAPRPASGSIYLVLTRCSIPPAWCWRSPRRP